MATGSIKKVVSDRGFGFITAEDGKDYFFGSASRGGDCLRICQSNWQFNIDDVSYREGMSIKSNPSLWLEKLPAYPAARPCCDPADRLVIKGHRYPHPAPAAVRRLDLPGTIAQHGQVLAYLGRQPALVVDQLAAGHREEPGARGRQYPVGHDEQQPLGPQVRRRRPHHPLDQRARAGRGAHQGTGDAVQRLHGVLEALGGANVLRVERALAGAQAGQDLQVAASTIIVS